MGWTCTTRSAHWPARRWETGRQSTSGLSMATCGPPAAGRQAAHAPRAAVSGRHVLRAVPGSCPSVRVLRHATPVFGWRASPQPWGALTASVHLRAF